MKKRNHPKKTRTECILRTEHLIRKHAYFCLVLLMEGKYLSFDNSNLLFTRIFSSEIFVKLCDTVLEEKKYYNYHSFFKLHDSMQHVV